MKKNNILLFILDLLDVKYTKIYARKYYEEHPHKNDLLGVSNMLYHYGIKSEGLKLEREINLTRIGSSFYCSSGWNFCSGDRYKNKINLLILSKVRR